MSAKQDVMNYICGDNIDTGYFVNIIPDGKFEYYAAGLSNYLYNPTGWGIKPPQKGYFNVYASCEDDSCSATAFEAALGIPAGSSTAYPSGGAKGFYTSMSCTGLSSTIDNIVNNLFKGNVGNGQVTLNAPLDTTNVKSDDGNGFDWTKLTPKRWKYNDLATKESFMFTSDSTGDGGMRNFLSIMLLVLVSVFVIVGVFYLVKEK